ncbi:MAG: N(4)-(beta-N-acetylglucosaminyl)-L-asparaginase [Bacteroidetes bacterium]|nr:N(4)-(beta-N-acetylglucosaminyl)-L-asparaginase [Bacteroidota bacterium]
MKTSKLKTRREFLKITATGTIAAGVLPILMEAKNGIPNSSLSVSGPIVISTWNHGLPANEAAWKILSAKGTAIDAVEKGVNVIESDPENTSVGIGGAPDRDGRVTLDACIMNHNGDCGSVACLEHIVNPVSVARMVMEKTPHVMIVGDGALAFAIDQGFKKTDLLTPKSKIAWKEWLKSSQYKPVINIENHDTIGMLAMDHLGNLSGSCTTSGLAYKMHGRVGDSPIIGAGLFVDNEVGAACATGLGETVIRQCGSFLVVELMRQGISPTEACKIAVERIIKHEKNIKDLQVGFLAMNKKGETGAYAIHSGFNYAKYDTNGNKLIDSDFSDR